MSLYNMMFGVCPIAGYVLQAIGLTPEEVPRLRDAYIAGKDGEPDHLVVLTRSGGANRADYAEENEALRMVEGYLSDEDDEFDATFAVWRFAIPGGDKGTGIRAAWAGAKAGDRLELVTRPSLRELTEGAVEAAELAGEPGAGAEPGPETGGG